jgi:NAD(P)-dependent dehydrogenase (short-subunit alcohol dehydrogenase family)
MPANTFDFSGKVAPITRGSRGIGRTTAELFSQSGAKAIGRVSEPAEIAGMVLFLCSDFASFAVGQTFVIDGGYTTH